MKNSNSRMIGLLAILLVVAASLQLLSLPRSVCADRERSKPGQRACEAAARSAEKETPPDDWFVTQRVTHGGIPIGAPERAAAQAAALAQAAEQSNRPLATARWRFVGPTNIGGRVVDIAVDPVAADTIYIAAATGGVWKSTGSRSTIYFHLAGSKPAIDGSAGHHTEWDSFRRDGRGQPRWRKHYLWRRGHFPLS